MAGRNHRLLKQTYRLFASAGSEADGPAAAAASSSFASSPFPPAVAADEFDESDVWGSPADDVSRDLDAGSGYGKPMAAVPGIRGAPRKPSGRSAVAAASLPVNIPDWSKILQQDEYAKESRGGQSWGADEDGDDEGAAGTMVPPHEYLWRKRGTAASFSVHEGVGRTLKGRDLSRVRNAVWRQTGFQD